MKREEATKVAFGIGAWIHTAGNSVLFTPSQFYEFANAIEARTIERCAQVCRDHPDGLNMLGGAFVICAQAIEALKDDQ